MRAGTHAAVHVPRFLALYIAALFPTLIAIYLICLLKPMPCTALLLCLMALVITTKLADRRALLPVILASVLFAAYYLPPHNSFRIEASHQILFGLFLLLNVLVGLDETKLKQRLVSRRVTFLATPGSVNARASKSAVGTVSLGDASDRHALSVRARVLYLDHTAVLGGGELALLNLIQTLNQEAYTPLVALFSDGPLAVRLRENNIETHILPLASGVVKTRKDSLGWNSLLRLKDIAHVVAFTVRLTGFIRRHRIDIVHANSLKADVIGGLAARLARTPVVWHVRDRIEPDYLPRPIVTLFRRLCRIIPNYVVANSQATLETIHLGRGAKSVAIPSGMRVAQPRDERSEVLSAPPYDAAPAPARQARVGLVGRIAPWKGQHIFLQAAAVVRRQYPQTRFLIIGAALFGEEKYEEEIRALTLSLDLEDYMEFTGFRNDVPELIASLDLLVHASTSAEPFGRVIVEGMAAGKPVVATNGGGVSEIVVDGVTGLLVPMGDAGAMADAICRLLADPPAARRMGEEGLARAAAHFTIEHATRKVESVYAQLRAGSRK